MRIINLRQNTPSSDLSGQSTTPSQSIVIGRQWTESSQRKRFGGQLTPVWPGIEIHNCKSGHRGTVCGTTVTGLVWNWNECKSGHSQSGLVDAQLTPVSPEFEMWMGGYSLESNEMISKQDQQNKRNVSVIRVNIGLSQYRSNVLQRNYMLNTFMMIRFVPTHNVKFSFEIIISFPSSELFL
jgi:hypothetical protein